MTTKLTDSILDTREIPEEFDLPWTNDPDWYCSPEELDEGDAY